VFNVKRFALRFVLLFILCSALFSLSEIGTVKASETIYIRSDGSVEGTDKIQRDGDVYTFTADIFDSYGIVVERDNIVVDGAGYTLQGTGNYTGISLVDRSNVTVRNVEIRNFSSGIRISDTWFGSGGSRNNVTNNNITNNTGHGIVIADSKLNEAFCGNNIVFGNTITSNDCGIFISYSTNNVLRNNQMNNNTYNLWVECENNLPPSDFVNDIDASNTVDGKPIYYWVDERDKTVPSDAGYVALINCTAITVNNLNLANNGQGVLLVSTTNSTITKNNITNSLEGVQLYGPYGYCNYNSVVGNKITANTRHGIHLWESHNTIITENHIAKNQENGIDLFDSRDSDITGNTITENNGCGIKLWFYSGSNTISANYIANNNNGIQIDRSLDNNIIGNNITNNSDNGIHLWDSDSTSIIGNNITNNGDGIWVYSCYYNIIHHNNFVNNTVHAGTDGSIVTWDNGSEGNYWDNYTGVDNDGDGIGDTPYVVDENNQDNYPLVKPMHVCTIPPPPASPVIIIVSPENMRYAVNTVSLTFTVSEPTSWVGYSLDGQANVTITGNTTLTGLSEGSHSLIVFAKDEDGNTGASGIIYFNIAPQPDPFPITWVVATIVVIAVVGAVLLVYFRRIRKTTGGVERN